MIGSVHPRIGQVDARSLAAVFSNHTRCATCRGHSDIRVHFCPGCPTISGSHYHRHCPCGATWPERSAGHATSDIQLGNPRWVPLCQHCEAKHTDLSSMSPRCCRRSEVSYHDTTDPCEACQAFAAV